MVNAELKEQFLDALDRLTPEQQQQALDLVRGLGRPRGKPGRSLLKFAGRIPLDDLEKMEKAIEDLGKVDPNEW